MAKKHPVLEIWEAKLKKFELVLLVLIFLVLFSLSLVNLILRNFLSHSWVFDFTEKSSWIIPHLVLGLGLLGASVGLSRGDVIRMEFFTRFISKEKLVWINRLHYIMVLALILLILIIILYYAKSLLSSEKYWLYFLHLPLWFLLFLKSLFRVIVPPKRNFA